MTTPEAYKNVLVAVRQLYGDREIVDQVSAAHDVPGIGSFNSVGRHAFEGYLRLAFDRRQPAAVERAHQWNRALHQRLADGGLYPLRLNVEQMASFVDHPDDDFWSVVGAIKDALDPNRIIAPGRYCP